jgi:hypothetical protein
VLVTLRPGRGVDCCEEDWRAERRLVGADILRDEFRGLIESREVGWRGRVEEVNGALAT